MMMLIVGSLLVAVAYCRDDSGNFHFADEAKNNNKTHTNSSRTPGRTQSEINPFRKLLAPKGDVDGYGSHAAQVFVDSIHRIPGCEHSPIFTKSVDEMTVVGVGGFHFVVDMGRLLRGMVLRFDYYYGKTSVEYPLGVEISLVACDAGMR